MAWMILIVSGVLEAVWAIALAKSEGFTKAPFIALFIVTLIASMGGLAYATKTLPIGTAYAVWVGIGVALTVVFAMLTGAESVSVAKVALLVGIVACVAGLRILHS